MSWETVKWVGLLLLMGLAVHLGVRLGLLVF